MRQKHFFSILLMLLCLGISNVWAADTNTPTSGSQYRLKAVKTGTGAGTYYMVAPTSSGLGGATTTEADGTVFTFTQESSKWYVTFTNNSTTYYMYEHSDNGKVSISTQKTEVAIGTNGNFIKIGSSKWIQFNYNSGNCRMGAYSSSQTGVVLSSVATPEPTV